MKKILTFKTFILFLFILASCEGNKDMLMYDQQNSNYVYFAPPFKLDAMNRPLDTREDSLVFSFGLAEFGTTEYTYKIPVNIAGIASNKDREYIIELIESETTAIEGEEYAPISTRNIFRAGSVTDTLKIKVFVSDALKKGEKKITIKMLPSADFMVGAEENSKIILCFTNKLNEPSWWKAWSKSLGEYCQEKYQKFINIYPLPEEGRSFDVNYYNNQTPVYWDNMPRVMDPRDCPVTMLKISVLKKYFYDNIVYIDGDPLKGRVTIP